MLNSPPPYEDGVLFLLLIDHCRPNECITTALYNQYDLREELMEDGKPSSINCFPEFKWYIFLTPDSVYI